jgi:hypothetical protein
VVVADEDPESKGPEIPMDIADESRREPDIPATSPAFGDIAAR